MNRRILGVQPLIYIVLVNLIGMILVILADNHNGRDMMILSAGMCVMSIAIYAVINLCRLGDPYLFVIISMLSSIGVIMQSRLDGAGGMRQMKLYLIGVVCFFIVMLIYKVFHKYWNRLTLLYFSCSIILFVLTAIFGSVKYGSKNWIIIGGISVQPSEFIRLLFVLSLASVCTNPIKKTSDIREIKAMRLIAAGLICFVNVGCLLMQREWGIAVLFFVIYFMLMYIYGESRIFLFANLLMAIFAGFIGVNFMSHIRVRVATWLDPFQDVSGKGYQLAQSLFAIGSGGFAGSGIGSGSPYLIPIVSSDFIFSAICEEMGVLGGVAVLMLYFVLVYRGFKIALSSTNAYNRAVSIGLSVMLGVQTFIIVGGVTRLIPLTGITLPFISYGGSSMITTFAALGILQAVSGMKGETTDEIE